MNTGLEQLRNALNKLNSRERLTVMAGFGVLLALALYLFVWEPLQEKQAALNASIAAQQNLYQKMLKSAAEARQLKSSTGQVRSVNVSGLQSIINRSAKTALPGAVIKRVELNRRKAVQVWIDQVAFDDMIRWLGGLQQTRGVRVESLFSERTAQAGRVNVRLSLKAG